MLEVTDHLPPGALCGAGADILTAALTASGAIWWATSGLSADKTGAVTHWTDQSGTRVARPTAPNSGNGQIGEAGDLAGLQCRDGLHCGMIAEDVARDAATVTLAARYLPPYGEDAKTVLTYNTGGGARKSADDNYLFLSEADGVLTIKDDRGLIEATMPAPKDDMVRLVTVSLARDRLAVSMFGGAFVHVQAGAPVLSGPASLFIGCRNQRSGLTKTLGGALISDVWLWPDRAVLLSDDPTDQAALMALRRFALWADDL
jgi:hypothetical protein